uniref:Uncharacterized protein n=1 Tax=Oryza rufipogon TaxID=4529 RepID=A0A0E0QJK1_ORYRU
MGYGLARLLLVALAALSLLAMGGLDDHHAGLSLAALPRDGMSEPAGPAGEGVGGRVISGFMVKGCDSTSGMS